MMLIHKLLVVVLAVTLGTGCTTGPTEPAEPAPVEEPPVDLELLSLNRILVLENLRSDPQGELAVFARDVELEIRLAAVRALGRFPFPEHAEPVTETLIAALSDRAPEVRTLAALGLGLRADPASAPTLKRFIANWDGEEALVCASIVEAAGRFEDKELRREVMYATDHSAAQVRVKAARAAALWSTQELDAEVVDNRLAKLASRAPAPLLKERWKLDEASANKMQREQIEVICSALYALSRREAELGRDVYYLWCRADASVEARIFAARGLASLKAPRPAEFEALRECLKDKDWRVAVAAAKGLEKSTSGADRVALELALAEVSNMHVKLACIDALGHVTVENKLMIESVLEQQLGKNDRRLLSHALVSLARIGKDAFEPKLRKYLDHHRPIVRKAVVQATQFLSKEKAVPLLDMLVQDVDPYVAWEAAMAFGKFLDDGGRARARLLLEHTDNGIRLGAVLALKQSPTQEDLPMLTACYDSSRGEISDEIQMEVLEIAGALDPNPAAQALLRKGLKSKRPHLQELAHKSLVKIYGRPDSALPVFAERQGSVPTLERRETNPRVRISTEDGDMTFQLFPTEAPVHVHNFLTLARSGHYDGLRIHRVVSGFVVQGGDHRGDGNGGQSWRDDHEPLRHEFSELPYERGSLGMPRNADPDSGGSQWFVTQMTTPHLDGRYTLFGKMVLGDERTLDKILEGAQIKKVTVLGE